MTHINQIILAGKTKQSQLLSKKPSPGWWTPLWKGLATDPEGKHRQAMGLSIWLYLYLLTYANRTTGTFSRKLETIGRETGLPLRTVQRHLKRLAAQKYITPETSHRPIHIRIERWKLFKHKKFDDE